MPGHIYHHFVPRFYLKGWTTNHLLTRLQWLRGELEVREVAVKRTAGLNHLYALRHASDDPQRLERDFMGPFIDEPAAQVYHQMVSGQAKISSIQRRIWTRFLMSLRVRTPIMIERLRADAEEDLRQRLMEQPEEYDSIRGHDDPRNLYEFMERHRPGFVADFGIRMLPDLLNHEPIVKRIFEMYW